MYVYKLVTNRAKLLECVNSKNSFEVDLKGYFGGHREAHKSGVDVWRHGWLDHIAMGIQAH